MNTATLIDIGELITRSPEILGGRPRIAGTRLTVHWIADLYNHGFSPSEIAAKYEHVNLAQVYAALAYYHANKGLIDAELAADEVEAERIERQHRQSIKGQ